MAVTFDNSASAVGNGTVASVAQAREQIVSLYDDFAMELEIAALMRKREEAEEEALIRLLM